MIRFILALVLLVFPAQAYAWSSAWEENEGVAARLISGVTAVGDEATIPLGLEIKLAEGWHTYWRTPGQAGLPPQFDWTLSQNEADNLFSASLLYPTPRRYSSFGLETVGYREHVVFPLDVTLRQKGRALRARGTLDILVCSSICMPRHFELELMVPQGPVTSSDEAEILRLARLDLPSSPQDSGILLKGVETDNESVKITFAARSPIQNPDVFIETDQNVGFSAPELEIDSSGFGASLKVKPVDTLRPGLALADIPLTLTIVNGDEGTEFKAVKLAHTASPAPYIAPKLDFKIALLFAFIGGFILNLMPCVLPVLSLKIVGLVGHGGVGAEKVRQSFLATTSGILFSFFVLALFMVLFKRLGLALGWGIQFQQPAFLMFLVLLLTFFAANLWDLFEISLPRFLIDKVENIDQPTLAGDFAAGAFATILATPCSAPFLGTAVGFAFASGPSEIIAIFMLLGLGMALPYLIVALFPRLAALVPKPGPWMVTLRHALGIALAFTALWLLFVMSAQITDRLALGFGMLMVALVLLLALKRRSGASRLTTLGIVIVCAAAVAMGMSGKTYGKASETDRAWIAYSPASLRADIAEGKTVFLDVTADWCLTCKANQMLTLSRSEVAERLFHSDVIAMQANWTNPDPVIAELLQKFGRYGIPFNVVYGPGAPQGLVLPELLTPSAVLKALDDAAGKANPDLPHFEDNR